MTVAEWVWLLALFANTADTESDPSYVSAKYKTFFIEQPVSTEYIYCLLLMSVTSTYSKQSWFYGNYSDTGVTIML